MDMKKLLSILDGMTYSRVKLCYVSEHSHSFEIEVNDDMFEHDLIEEGENIQETLILGDRGEFKIATYHIKQFDFDDRGDYIHTLEIITDIGTITLKQYV